MVKDVSDFAIYDPAFATDGLFVPRTRKGWALYDVNRSYDRGEISFKGEQLTAAHQSVLLAVCARTGRNGLAIRGSDKDIEGCQISLELEETGSILDEDVSVVAVSAYSLLVDAGMNDGGNDYKRMVKLLEELSAVGVYRRVGKNGGSSKVLSFRHEGDQLNISLNWRVAQSIFGKQNIQVSLHERNRLDSSVAKLLHCWLSCHVRHGQSLMNGQGALLDTLIKHVYGKRPCSQSAHRKRRTLLRSALAEINNTSNWAAVEDNRGIWHIARPERVKDDEYYLGSPGQKDEFMRDLM